MAKLDQGILGGFSGKVGTVIGSKWKNFDIIKSVPGKRSGKSTQAQLEHRIKFGLMMKFIQPLSKFFMTTFSGFDVNQTPVNSAFSYNFKNAVAGTYPNFTVDYSHVIISRGDLTNGEATTAEAGNAGDVTFKWTNNSGIASAKATDKAVVVVYCPDLKTCTYSLAGSARSSGSFTINASNFKSKVVETWLGFISADGKDIATSFYTGRVTVV